MLAMAGNILLRSVLGQAADFVLDALLPRATSAATAAVPRSTAKLPAQVQGSAAAAAIARSTAKLPAQVQGGGATTMTMAELHARRVKMIGEELKDYKIYRHRRDLSKQAAEGRNKLHTKRVVAVGATAASAFVAAGIYKARGGDAAPSV